MSDQVAVFLCLCGCETQVRPPIKWFRGHKPPKVKKTKEEKSASYRARWDRFRAEHPEKQLKPCACGCGEMVKGKWAWGHHSRVKNISKRKDIREKRRENFAKLHKEGKLKPWNRGLDKEDKRVAANIRGLMETVHSEEHRKMHSDLMRKHRLDGTVPTLRGPDHPNWKGGVSSITQMLRGNHQLYIGWKRPILQRDGWICRECGKGSQDGIRLAVHHDKERFSVILQKHLVYFFGSVPERELSWEEKEEICQLVVEYHIQSNVSGITLCYDCHEKIHEIEKDDD